MKHITYLILAVILLSACTGSETHDLIDKTESKVDHTLAQANYTDNCAGCHGAEMRAFVDRLWINGDSKEDLMRSIKQGILEDGMPAFDTTFTAQEISGLADYILNGINERKSYDVGAVVAPQFYQTDNYKIEAETLVEDIGIPWGIKVQSDGTMFFTEREGKLSRRDKNGGIAEIKNLPTVNARGQGGMMDVALHPNFETNQMLYLSYSKIDPENEGQSTTAVIRGVLVEDELTEIEEIFEALPYSEMNHHYGCRLVFDNEGLLYISVGDRGARDENPQSVENFCGKIHRVHDDGSIPADNPFVDQEGAVGSIWTFGNRNPQGLAYDRSKDILWENEHGPRGGDELNVMVKGTNYGWPVASYGINYNGTTFTQVTDQEDFKHPLTYWTPSIAPSGMAVVEGDKYPLWNGDLLSGSLRFNYVSRVKMDGETILEEEKILTDIGRIRSIEMGQDGFLYLGVENPSRIIRINSVDEIPADANKDIDFSIEHQITVDGLLHCESVAHDKANNCVYVSCIGEREEEDGSIAKIGLDGTVLELDFITGLGNPHGLAIYGETLYTADDTVLVEISLATRSVVARHIAPEAVFLNDVCTDDEGNVYVSDMRKSAIYRLKDGHFEEWMNTPDLDMPNGLLCDGNLMFVASWGPEWGVNGMLMSMDLDDKELEKIVPFRFGNLDGVQRNGEGWMVSDWVNGAILAVSKEGHPTKVLSTEMSVGDICFIEESGLLFLPMNYQNRMHIYQFKAKD